MRYNRHLILQDLNLNEDLLNQRLVILGCGGIGTHFAYLAASLGIKNIMLIDRDIIDVSNLNRQLLFFESDIGLAKAEVLRNKLEKLNSEIAISSQTSHLDQFNIDSLIPKENVIVVDCSDNLEVRHLLNEYCVKNKLKFISSAAIKTSGYVYTYVPGSACINCFLENKKSDTSCGIDGILNGTLSMCSSIMISELIKIITNRHQSQLIKFDSFNYTINKIKVKINPDCPTCQKNEFSALNSKKVETTKFCSGHYQKFIKSENLGKRLEELKQKAKKSYKVIDIGTGFKYENIIVFNDGRVMIKANSAQEAEKLFNDYT